jgi:hypothetical protein
MRGAGEGDRGPTEELSCDLGRVTKGHLCHFPIPFSNPLVVTRALFCRTAVALARPLMVHSPVLQVALKIEL